MATLALAFVVLGSSLVLPAPVSAAVIVLASPAHARTVDSEAAAGSAVFAAASRTLTTGPSPPQVLLPDPSVPWLGPSPGRVPLPTAPAAGASSGGGSWQKLGAVDGRYAGPMAYDAADGYIVEFGGYGAPGSTWTYANGTWTNATRTVVGIPPPRAGASMLYDPTLGEIILFGGGGSLPGGRSYILNDTWTYHAGTWTNRTGSFGAAPEPREFAGFAYDPNDSVDVLFGGLGRTGMAGGTWELSSGGWSNVTSLQTGSPSLEAIPTMAEDGTDGSVVLFGDGNQTQSRGNETWEFTGNRWANVTGSVGSAPPARVDGGAAMDSTGGGVVLFGGYGAGSPLPLGLADTWRFVHGSWTRLSTGTPNPEDRVYEETSDNPGGSGILVSGGSDYFNLTFYTDTWSFGAGHWTLVSEGNSPNPRSGPSMAYDSTTGQVILFGGSGLNDTWSFSHGQWSLLHPARAPSGRFLATLADDPADSELVLFGGESITGGTRLISILNDTWVWANGSWTNITATAQGPPARTLAASAYDSTAQDVVLYGGLDAVGDFYDTWTFHGGRWSAAPTNTTVPRGSVGVALANDPSDSGVVLFGGESSAAKKCPLRIGLNLCQETWTFSGGNWTNRTASSAPPPRWDAGMVYDASYGTDLLYGGQGWGCHPIPNGSSCAPNLENDTWSYAAGHWTNLSGGLGTPPDGGVGPAFAYDGTDGAAILYGSMDGELSNVASGSWWSLTAGTSSGPVSVGVPAATVNPVAVGGSTTLSVTVSGGAPPYSIVWDGLPAGCSSTNATTLLCVPSASGTFAVTVHVTDALGTTGTGSTLSLHVTAGPVALGSVQIISHALQVQVGGTLALSAQAYDANGDALSGVRYGWTLAPANLATANVTNGPAVTLTALSAAGTLAVQVSATFGSATVDAAATVTIYDPTGAPLNVTSFFASPSSVTVGSTTTLGTVVTGGTAPYTYLYSGLPAGCDSVNAANVSCTPTVAGSFLVQVHVIDFAQSSHSAFLTLVVTTGLGGVTSVLPGPVWIAIGAAAVVVAVVATILVIRGRGRPPAPEPSTDPEATDGATEDGVPDGGERPP
ncbi:MAG: hypothetical protein L3J86_00515 [Thermoplasmata archaeon]|nr:hypothetical protein [Thermoplasmata archaeon]